MDQEHRGTIRRKGNRRWIGECSCGYRSTTRTMERLAAAAIVHHVVKLRQEAKRNGLEPTRTPASKAASPTLSHPPAKIAGTTP